MGLVTVYGLELGIIVVKSVGRASYFEALNAVVEVARLMEQRSSRCVLVVLGEAVPAR